ncbi:hypothetical protein [Cyanobium sp. LEGE 06143]|nr:hypothetical protein [Cyanobium sp. LEGE 06143]
MATALLSAGLSLNDGSLALGPAIAGTPMVPWWAAGPVYWVRW